MKLTAEEEHRLNNLERRIKVKYKDINLLKNALIHRSYLNESKESDLENNEKMEFLGDAVLELIVTQHLFESYPGRTEGELTSFRAATVRTESLAETAAELDLGSYIYMSKGEEATGGRQRPYILANTFEALLGSIFLDQGMESATAFVVNFLLPKIQVIVEKRLDIDAKSQLQEVAQEQLGITPDYEFVSSQGPDHAKTFEMAVKMTSHKFASGMGKSKQEAEQKAAESALENWDTLVKKYFH